jgi:hypothetical protein
VGKFGALVRYVGTAIECTVTIIAADWPAPGFVDTRLS